MKKYVIAITMMLALGLSAGAASQKHRHSQQSKELVDTTQTRQDAVEAYSDTTSVASDPADDYGWGKTMTDEEAKQAIKGALVEVFDNVDGKDVAGVLIVVFLGLFVLFLPLIILVAIIIYFVNRNRRDRIRLAQMAMQNGQQIPDELLKERKDEWDKDDYASGMKQLFLGLGLMVFLGYTAGKIGFAIGALVFFIGLGKVVIARTGKNKELEIKNEE